MHRWSAYFQREKSIKMRKSLVRETKSGSLTKYLQTTDKNTILKMQRHKEKNASQVNLKLGRLSVRTFLKKRGINWTKGTSKKLQRYVPRGAKS